MMRLFLAILCTILSLQAGIGESLTRNKKVIIVFGKDAPEEEKQLAQRLYKSLDLENTGDVYDHIIEDEYALKHKFFYAGFHLIVIGNERSNRLCQMLSDIQIANLDENSTHLPSLRQFNLNGSNFWVSRYGNFVPNSETGILRRLLNPFALEAYNLTNGAFSGDGATVQLISGTDFKGIQQALIAFMDSSLLEGIVTLKKAPLLPATRFKAPIFNEFPKALSPSFSMASNNFTLKMAGWIQGTSADYSGTSTLCGVMPEQICHLKFNTSASNALLTYEDNNDTLLAIKFKNASDCQTALINISKTMKIDLKVNATDELQVFPTVRGQDKWSFAIKSDWLIIENLSNPWKELFPDKVSNLFK